MNPNNLPAKPPTTSLAARARAVWKTTAEVVVPTAMVGAGYLVAGGHWIAFKAMLAGWGVPTGISAMLAPVVMVLAFLGLREVIRMMNAATDQMDDPDQQQRR